MFTFNSDWCMWMTGHVQKCIGSGIASLDLMLGHSSFYNTPCVTISLAQLLPYSGKVWWEKSLANLAKLQVIRQLKPAKPARRPVNHRHSLNFSMPKLLDAQFTKLHAQFLHTADSYYHTFMQSVPCVQLQKSCTVMKKWIAHLINDLNKTLCLFLECSLHPKIFVMQLIARCFSHKFTFKLLQKQGLLQSSCYALSKC